MSQRFYSRRELLTRCGWTALPASRLPISCAGASIDQNGLAPRLPHFAAKAKAVISILLLRRVSQVDTFDPKPELAKRAGEAMTGKGDVVVSQGHPGGFIALALGVQEIRSVRTRCERTLPQCRS